MIEYNLLSNEILVIIRNIAELSIAFEIANYYVIT